MKMKNAPAALAFFAARRVLFCALTLKYEGNPAKMRNAAVRFFSAASGGTEKKLPTMYYNMVFAKNVLKPAAAGGNSRFFGENRF